MSLFPNKVFLDMSLKFFHQKIVLHLFHSVFFILFCDLLQRQFLSFLSSALVFVLISDIFRLNIPSDRRMLLFFEGGADLR